MSWTIIIHQAEPTSREEIIEAYRTMGGASPVGDDQVTVETERGHFFIAIDHAAGPRTLDDYEDADFDKVAAIVDPHYCYSLSSSDPELLAAALPYFPVRGAAAVDNDFDDILPFADACAQARRGAKWLDWNR